MAMPKLPNRFDRKLHNRTCVGLPLASASGSAAWSLAGRGTMAGPEHLPRRLDHIELGDRALPILNRN